MGEQRAHRPVPSRPWVVAGFATMLVCGAFDVHKTVAYGFAVIVAVVTSQVWSLTGRRARSTAPRSR